jgi:hypothetical protein
VDIKKNLTYAQYDATQNPAIVVDSNIFKTCNRGACWNRDVKSIKNLHIGLRGVAEADIMKLDMASYLK